MGPYLNVAIAFVVGLGVGFGLARLRVRARSTVDDDTAVPPPLDQAEYDKRLAYIDLRYHDAMAQYDKLIPWAAGGGLVVSMTFISAFAQSAPSWTKWILGGAWGALVMALLCSILSQYASTRIQVWAKSYLKSRQNPPDQTATPEANEAWRRETIAFERRSAKNGSRTKILNVSAGILLVVGLITLGLFAMLAVPFGQAGTD